MKVRFPPFVTFFWLLAASLLVGGCSKMYEVHTLADRNGVQEFELNVPAGAVAARFRIKAAVSSGKIQWELTNPQGESVISGWRDRQEVRGDFGRVEAPEAGLWRLRIDLVEVTGHYRVAWSAS